MTNQTDQQKSLQTRLLGLVLGLVTVVWLGAAILTWYDAQHELDELLDGHLAQIAGLLVAQQANADGDEDDVANAPSLHKYAPQVAFQVFHEGHLMMRSANAEITPMSDKARGFSTVQLSDKTEWRVFATRGAERDVQVYVGEQTTSRNAILRAVLRSVLLPLTVALPVLALALWWAVRRGLTPLRQLSQLLRQRRPQTLEPVMLADMPLEMVPVVRALNELFERIEHMVASERRFTADAAHELRTPIAAIRAQAQVAQGAGDNTAQREHALQATVSGCDRAARLVEQLLTLARLETPLATPATTLDLSAITRRVAGELAPNALSRRQALELDAQTQCPITGDDVLIGVLVRNLIDNALRYSPQGASIKVGVTCESGQAVLRVQDSGAGMAPQDMARLGERFFRVLGQTQPGSGLGWSIVRRIADAFGARLQVSQSELLGGLCVSVFWPGIQAT